MNALPSHLLLTAFFCGLAASASAQEVTGDRLNLGSSTTSNLVQPLSGAIGNGNFADGQGAFCLGVNNNAWLASLSLGYDNESYYSSLAVGYGNTLMYQSAAIGTLNANWVDDSNGVGSLLVGYANYNEASSHSLIVGENNATSSAGASTTLGTGLVNMWYNTTVIGRYNRETHTAWPLFIVGNGGVPHTYDERRDAFVIYQNGDIRIPKAQGDILMGEFGTP